VLYTRPTLRRTGVLAAATAIALAFSLGVALQPLDRLEAKHSGTTLDRVRHELATRYYRDVPDRVLQLRTVDGMLAALDDPYTRYLPPGELRLAQRAIHEGFSGVGLTLIPGEAGLLVTRTLQGPAKIAGIRPGDTVLAVDGTTVAGLPFQEAIGRIIGREGSVVRLRVLRDRRVLTFGVVRQRFRTPTVHVRALAGGVGLLRIDRFAVGTTAAVRTGALRLERGGADGLVLDLRGNPGGLLRQAVGVASVFLDEGQTIVALGGVHRRESIIYARGGAKVRLPLIVLVDGRSASAAEVVAAALHDHERARLVGEATFGKSLVQEVDRLGASGALKLTVATYRTPTGRDIADGGVVPDVTTKQPLARAVALLTA
jgi:carboxyl-terminal processing protease